MNQGLGMDKTKELRDCFKRSIMLLIDERSMLSSEILGACDRNLKQTLYDGVCDNHDFGGIPIVLLLGDDYQLPPVVIGSKGKGAFYVFRKTTYQNMTQNVCLMKAVVLNYFNF